MKLIDKAAILAEIDNLQSTTMDEDGNSYTAKAQAEYNVLCDLESFINTLEVKSFTDTIKTEKDLEKEAMEFVKTKDFISNKNPITSLAAHFYELGKAQKGE